MDPTSAVSVQDRDRAYYCNPVPDFRGEGHAAPPRAIAGRRGSPRAVELVPS